MRGEAVYIGLARLNPRAPEIPDLGAGPVEGLGEGAVRVHAQRRPDRKRVQLQPLAQLL